MKWSYDLCGATPIIKDEPVYNSAIIGNGEYLMLGTSLWTAGADAGFGLINAVPSTVATAQAVNGVGISTQTITTAGNGAFYSLNAPQSVANALNATAYSGVGLRNVNSMAFTKTIINPFAVYRTLVSQNSAGTSDILTCAAAASNTTIQFVVTSMSAATGSFIAGQWCYFCGTAGPNFGTLRKVVSNASAATFILDAACTNAISSADRVVFFPEMNMNPNFLSTYTVAATNSANALGTCISNNSGAWTAASVGNQCLAMRIVDNYIEGGTYTGGIAQLRYNVQGQYTPAYNGTTPLVNKLSTVNFWQDLISLNHAFNASSTAY